MDDCSSGKFWSMLGGVVVGGLAGATAMFFLSPRSGKANRKMVKNKLMDMRDYIQEEKEMMEEKIQEIFGEVNQLTTSLFEDAKKLWDRQVSAFEKSMDKIDKNRYQEMVDNVMESLQSNKKYDANSLSKIKRYLNSQWRKFNEMID